MAATHNAIAPATTASRRRRMGRQAELPAPPAGDEGPGAVIAAGLRPRPRGDPPAGRARERWLLHATASRGGAARWRAARSAWAISTFRSRAAAGGPPLPRWRAGAASPRSDSHGAAARNAARRTRGGRARGSRPRRPTSTARGDAPRPSRGRSGCSGRLSCWRIRRIPWLLPAGPGPSCDTLRRAELGAPRAWVGRHFFVARHDRLLRQHLHEAVALLQRAQRVLDDAVFERVKGDHDQAPAGPQPAGGRFDEAVEPVELTVHPDAQRLKRARRRIDALVAAARQRAADDGGETAGGDDRRFVARLDDRAGDAARQTLFTELKNRVGDLAFRRTGDESR